MALICNLCSNKIYPFCPNSEEIIWMWENEDCLFPFNEEPRTLSEVCSLKPKYSPDSLFKQVHLVQEGKLSTPELQNFNNISSDIVEVQEDIIAQSCKINLFLTNSDQLDEEEDLRNNCEIIDDYDNDSVFNRIFMCKNDSEEDIQIRIEPIFKIEKVDNPLHSNIYSFTDLDSVQDQVSSCLSFSKNCSDLDNDIEMEDITSQFTLNDPFGLPSNTWSQKEAEKTGIYPTFNCTHSFIG